MSRSERKQRSPALRLIISTTRIGLGFILLIAICSVSGCMERLFYYPESGPTPPPAEYPGIEGVAFTSGDGTPLYGWFIPARNVPDGERPATILHVHGNAGNIESHVGFTDFLPPRGFNLFVFDYRGYGQSGGAAAKRADLIADTHAALDVLLERDDVDPERIGVYGQSLGGAIALNVIADRPEIKTAVIDSSFTSWRAIAGEKIPAGGLLSTLMIRDTHRPIDAIARIDRPLLVVVGTADTIVPAHHGRALAAACAPAELLELEGGEHNSLRWTHPELDGAVIDFYRRQFDSAEKAGKDSSTESP
jgi:dipeptidyl aminopeptidase/acylaminoacyl peptidase